MKGTDGKAFDRWASVLGLELQKHAEKVHVDMLRINLIGFL